MPSLRPLVIGSRGSRLALWQARWVKDRLEENGQAARIQEIRTSGDRFHDRSLAAIGGEGLFVKEIEEAILAGGVDLAVHSLKDLPTRQPEGLLLACVPPREDPRDLLVARGARSLKDLPSGWVIGTGSPRRACQIRNLRPDLTIRDLRGNVDTRVARWENGDYDAIILASAGVRRLGLALEASPIPLAEMLPAVGQGALAIETRADDAIARAATAPLHHPPTAAAVASERAFLRGLGGGCQAPIAASAEIRGDRLVLLGLAADPLGRRVLRDRIEGAVADAEELGLGLAANLLERGASELLASRGPQSGGTS
jgi:hydroxymethylbilane synthase